MASLRRNKGNDGELLTVKQAAWALTNEERHIESTQIHGWIKGGRLPDGAVTEVEGRKMINLAIVEEWMKTRPTRAVSVDSMINRYVKLSRSIIRSKALIDRLPDLEQQLERVVSQLNAVGVDVDGIDTRTDKEKETS